VGLVLLERVRLGPGLVLFVVRVLEHAGRDAGRRTRVVQRAHVRRVLPLVFVPLVLGVLFFGVIVFGVIVFGVLVFSVVFGVLVAGGRQALPG
jgi:hypothetical protein